MSMAWVVSACVLASAGVIPVSTSSCGVPRLLRVNGFERVGVFLFMFLMVCAYYSVDEPRSVAAGPEGVNRPALL
jgi:purine-cytosine permease-like protein